MSTTAICRTFLIKVKLDNFHLSIQYTACSDLRMIPIIYLFCCVILTECPTISESMSRMTELPTGINVIDVIHIKTLSDCFGCTFQDSVLISWMGSIQPARELTQRMASSLQVWLALCTIPRRTETWYSTTAGKYNCVITDKTPVTYCIRWGITNRHMPNALNTKEPT